MKRRVSRDISIFNLSMLDVICSALGAIVILFILSDQARTEAVTELKKADDTVAAVKSGRMKARAALNSKYQGKLHDLEEKVEGLKDKVAVLSKGQSKAQLKKRLARLQKEMQGIKHDWKSKKAMQRRMAQLLQQIQKLKQKNQGSVVRGKRRYKLWLGGGRVVLTDNDKTARGWKIRHRCRPSGGYICKGCGGTPMRPGGTVVQ